MVPSAAFQGTSACCLASWGFGFLVQCCLHLGFRVGFGITKQATASTWRAIAIASSWCTASFAYTAQEFALTCLNQE